MKILALFTTYVVTTIASFFVLVHCSSANEEELEQVDLEATAYEDWYYKKTPPFRGWKYIVLHHSATKAGSVKAFHNYHTQQGYGGIAYHFVIGNGVGMKDGEVQPTFRWHKQMTGTHVSVNSWDHNIFGIGICLVGNLEEDPPTAAQKKALKALIEKLKSEHAISDDHVMGHGDVPHDDDPQSTEQTKCPGKKVKTAEFN
jgi:hypothetical protein